MKINRILIVSIVALTVFVNNDLLKGETVISGYAGESILYLISPFGRSEYNDLGMVDLNGIKVNLVTLRTKILFFEDTEKIYSDPKTLLPYKLERTFSKLWIKEFITEEFDQKNFTVIRRRFKGGKLIKEEIIKVNGQIQSPIIFPFILRRLPELKIGWSITARFPDEFKLELVSIDEILGPAGKFQAYHFKSIPDKFEIWINKNNPQVPLKILGKGIFGCALLMKKYSISNNFSRIEVKP